MEWSHVGEITLLQIQTGEMTGQGSYDTSMLVQVDRLRLTPDGVFGLSAGAWIVDRHHRHHPAAKYWHSDNTLSFGFTSHYDHMWDLFRTTPLGIAGENVIGVADQMIEPKAIVGGIRIDTNDVQIELMEPVALEPCVEFTRFMTSRSETTAREVKTDREKLRNGVRGYAVGIDGPDPVEVGLGDTLWVRTV